MFRTFGFTGGVRVAVGDVTDDSVPDVDTAPGVGVVECSRLWRAQGTKQQSAFCKVRAAPHDWRPA